MQFAYEADYLPPTNTLGARVKITELATLRKWVFPYDYSENSANHQVRNILQDAGCEIVAQAYGRNDCMMYITEEPLMS